MKVFHYEAQAWKNTGIYFIYIQTHNSYKLTKSTVCVVFFLRRKRRQIEKRKTHWIFIWLNIVYWLRLGYDFSIKSNMHKNTAINSIDWLYMCCFARSINKYSEMIKWRRSRDFRWYRWNDEIESWFNRLLYHRTKYSVSIHMYFVSCDIGDYIISVCIGWREIDSISTNERKKKRHLSLVTCCFNLSTYHKTFSLRLLLVNVYGCDRETLWTHQIATDSIDKRYLKIK